MRSEMGNGAYRVDSSMRSSRNHAEGRVNKQIGWRQLRATSEWKPTNAGSAPTRTIPHTAGLPGTGANELILEPPTTCVDQESWGKLDFSRRETLGILHPLIEI